jgi:anthranilate phosphoribosyltransferase
MAGVLAGRGVEALVFRGDDGLDELSTAATSSYWEVRSGTVTPGSLDPTVLGVPRSDPGALRGGDAKFNAAAVRDLLAGKVGPVRDAVLLNAAAALAMLDRGPEPLVQRMASGLRIAAESVDSGAAAAALERWIAATRSRAGR